MNRYFKFDPVAVLTSLQLLVQAVVLLAAYVLSMDVQTLGFVQGVQAALFVFLSTFVRGAVTSNAAMDALGKLPQAQLDELHKLDK